MATKSKKKTSTKSSPRAVARPVESLASVEPTDFLRRIHGLQKGWSARLDDAHRRVFRAQFSDEACAKKGGETQSQNVAAEALRWAVVIDAEMRKHGELAGYAPRFAHLLECTAALGEELARTAEAQGRLKKGRGALDRAVAAAKDAHATLVDKLDLVARGDDDRAQKVDAVRAAGETASEVSDALSGSTALARALLKAAAHDEATAILLATFDVTAGDVDVAAATSAALKAAIDGAATGERARPKDSPAINLLEGRVLWEMWTAMKVFDAAAKKNARVQRLVPTKGVRRALISTRPKTAAAPATAPGAGTPAPKPPTDGKATAPSAPSV